MKIIYRSEEQDIKVWRASRLRGVRFLAEHALAAGDAHAFHIAQDGRVSIQGGQGSLQRLVQLLGAQPLTPEPDVEGLQMSEWEAAVTVDGGTVLVTLTETS